MAFTTSASGFQRVIQARCRDGCGLETVGVKDAEGAIDCPVCASPDALTPERRERLRDVVEKSSGLHTARDKAVGSLRALKQSIAQHQRMMSEAMPVGLTWTAGQRRERGFRIERVGELLSDEYESEVDSWLAAVKQLARVNRRFKRSSERALKVVEASLVAHPTSDSIKKLGEHTDAVKAAHASALEAMSTYVEVAPGVAEPLIRAVEEMSAVGGWTEFVHLGRHLQATRQAVVERVAYTELAKELEVACKQVDKAKEAVLDGKFGELDADVRVWWDLLRPDQPSYFAKMGLRVKAQRTIDFKAGLAKSEERESATIRDAVAVFSQSQLVCLGLATFLARAAVQDGFILLDDPMNAIDDDYSVFFINGVLGELLRRGVQVIVTTHSQATRKAIKNLYSAGECETFELTLARPVDGTMVVKGSDTLSVMLQAAQPFTTSPSLESRKRGSEMLRNAAERLCKELLVKKRREAGEMNALITDYTGAGGTLGSLIKECIPHLSGSDEPGKLNFLNCLMSPGNHDDIAPANAALTTCRGNLATLKRKYL